MKKSVLIFALIILLGSFAYSQSGEIDYQSNKIITTYSAGEKIKGSINFSFDGAKANEFLTSNFDGNITLFDFLEANGLFEGENFECSLPNCVDGYSTTGEINSATLEGEAIVGILLTGNEVSSIDSVSLNISSDAGPSCLPQIFIDVLNKGEYYVINNKASGESCGTEYTGCFDDVNTNEAVISSTNTYCEKITLPAAPSYLIGGNVKDKTTGSGNVKMILYDENAVELADCNLPVNTQEGYEKLSCLVNYPSSQQEEYFVCAKATHSSSDYKIKLETQSPTCGTNNFGELNTDYDLFAKSMQFSAVNNFDVAESFEETYNFELADYIGEYVSDNYNGECQNGCVIPIKITGQVQSLQFTSVKIRYDSQQGVIESNKIYSIEKEDAEISSDELELDIEKANFVIPLGSDEDEFKLYFAEDEIFSKEINLSASFAFDITPKFAAFGQNVFFTATTVESITTSTWDFGDGTPIQSVNGKTASHQYLETGTFEVIVTLKKVNGITATKEFTINVGNPKESVNLTIEDYKKRLVNLNNAIANFPVWIQGDVKVRVNTDDLNASLNDIISEYNLASTDDEYITLMLDLIELNVPYGINASNKGELPLVIGLVNADISYLEEVEGQEIEDYDAVNQQIAAWMSENTNARIYYEQISIFYDAGKEDFLTRFEIQTKPVSDISGAYLFLGYSKENIRFKESYGETSVLSGTYITMQGSVNKIYEFAISGAIEPEDLGAYISPSLETLGEYEVNLLQCNFNEVCEEGENWRNCRNDCKPWGLFLLWIIILLIVAFIAYIGLQEWYKKNYEKSLFKSKDDLYNIINFIYNGRRSGINDNEIRKRLSRWRGEQINYAFRKMDNKRTGMLEIPIFKFLENKKIKKEIARRQT